MTRGHESSAYRDATSLAAQARPALLLVAAVASLLVGTSPAGAQPLERARASYFAADFPGAERQFRAVLAASDVSARDAAVAHAHLASIAWAVGRRDEVSAHLEAAALLDPEVVAAEGSADEVAAELRRVVAHRADAIVWSTDGFRVRATLRARLQEGLELEVTCRGPGAAAPRVARGRAEDPLALTLAPGRFDCRASARDPRRAVWVIAEHSLAIESPTVEVPDDAADDRYDLDGDGGARSDSRDGDAFPWAWVIGAAVVVGAAVAVGIVVASSEVHPVGTETRVPDW